VVVIAAFAISDDVWMTDFPSSANPPFPDVRPVNARSILMAVSGMVTAMGLAMLTVLPAPYSVNRPGPTFDIFDDSSGVSLLSIDGAPTYPPSGELRITTVSVSFGSSSALSFGPILRAWLSPSAAVYPEYRSEGGNAIQQQWISSQERATVAALKHLGISVDATLTVVDFQPESRAIGQLALDDVIVGVDGQDVDGFDDLEAALGALEPGDPVTVEVLRGGTEVSQRFFTIDDGAGGAVMGIWVDPAFDFPFNVKVAIENVGGPSGGLMFALGILDLLTPEDELHGMEVAGTGTIDIDGSVGPIGGIDLKMIGAREDGAAWFLAPASNCSEVVGHVPDGLTVVAVNTLDDAYYAMVAIGTNKAVGLPTCS
jgi:PDZ domain-containing protein